MNVTLINGPTGSGKTYLAAELVAAHTGRTLAHVLELIRLSHAPMFTIVGGSDPVKSVISDICVLENLERVLSLVKKTEYVVGDLYICSALPIAVDKLPDEWQQYHIREISLNMKRAGQSKMPGWSEPGSKEVSASFKWTKDKVVMSVGGKTFTFLAT